VRGERDVAVGGQLRASEAEQVRHDQLRVEVDECGAEGVTGGGQPVKQHQRGRRLAVHPHRQRPGLHPTTRTGAPPAHGG
jgi:hypothetical protein